MERAWHFLLVILRVRHANWMPYSDHATRTKRSRRWRNGAWETREATDAEKEDMADEQTW